MTKADMVDSVKEDTLVTWLLRMEPGSMLQCLFPFQWWSKASNFFTDAAANKPIGIECLVLGHRNAVFDGNICFQTPGGVALQTWNRYGHAMNCGLPRPSPFIVSQ